MIRKVLAIILLVSGVTSLALAAPGVWTDYQIEREALLEASEHPLPDGGCSETMGIFVTCGFAVVHQDTGVVTLFDYIHLRLGPPDSISTLAMQTPDKSVLTLNYGMETLASRIQFLGLALGLVVLGGVLLTIGRRRG